MFGAARSAVTTVMFPAPGIYRLRLAATAAGRFPAHADTVVTVTPAAAATDPAGPAQEPTVDLRDKVGSVHMPKKRPELPGAC